MVAGLQGGNVIELPLSRGLVTIVDADRFEMTLEYHFRNGTSFTARPSALSWHACPGSRGNYFYATSRVLVEGKQVPASLSRLLTEAPANMVVDHISTDTMDNRLSNLRICTNAENTRNGNSRRGASKYKGVNHHRKTKWRAEIGLNGKGLHLGLFDCEEDAARAYDRAAIEHYGEFARLNFLVERLTKEQQVERMVAAGLEEGHTYEVHTDGSVTEADGLEGTKDTVATTAIGTGM